MLAALRLRGGGMRWPTLEEIAAYGSAGCAVATLLGAVLVYKQIGLTSVGYFASNAYLINKDLDESADRMLVAEDEGKEARSDDDRAKASHMLSREARKFDALFESADALQADHGLSRESWAAVLSNYCPFGDQSGYKFADVSLSALKAACSRDPDLWQARPR